MNDRQMTMQAVKDRVKKFRVERGWDKQDVKDYPMGLVLEAAEVLELFHWVKGEDILENDKLKQAIGDEMADVLYWLALMSYEMGIDLAEAFERKERKREKKYPLRIFGAGKDPHKKRKAYYAIKARTRGGHPLADEAGKDAQ